MLQQLIQTVPARKRLGDAMRYTDVACKASRGQTIHRVIRVFYQIIVGVPRAQARNVSLAPSTRPAPELPNNSPQSTAPHCPRLWEPKRRSQPTCVSFVRPTRSCVSCHQREIPRGFVLQIEWHHTGAAAVSARADKNLLIRRFLMEESSWRSHPREQRQPACERATPRNQPQCTLSSPEAPPHYGQLRRRSQRELIRATDAMRASLQERRLGKSAVSFSCKSMVSLTITSSPASRVSGSFWRDG